MHEMKSFEDEKSVLERKIKNDKRASVINTSVLKKIKNLYTITESKNGREDFYELADATFFSRNWQKPTDSIYLNKTLFQVKDTNITYDESATYLLKIHTRFANKKPDS